MDPQLAPAAAEMAVRLLVEHGGGTAEPAWTDAGDVVASIPVDMDPQLPSRLVGVTWTDDEVVETLEQIARDLG